MTTAIEVIWQPQEGPQKAFIDCPLPEVFFGGARGGGKTDAVLGKYALKGEKYGSGFNAVFFRRELPMCDDAIERSHAIYGPLGWSYNAAKYTWRSPGGARLRFRPLERVTDADKYQGQNISDAAVEEAGNYPDPKPIDRLNGVLRSALGVPTQLVLTGNPGGPGQQWIKQRYIDPEPRGMRVLERELVKGLFKRYIFIPSKVRDNRILMSADPEYIARLHMVGSEELVRAWLEGDWDAIEGAFFDSWSQQKHVIQPFAIPEEWLRFRSMDWGYAAPFSVGWWAVAADEHEVYECVIPRGALIRYREWYGATGPNTGIRMNADEVGAGITLREKNDPPISYGVLDPSAFAQDGGPSIAERIKKGTTRDKGVLFRPADNKRVGVRGAMGGWDQMRARLDGLDDGRPMVYFFNTCIDSIRTIPALQHDPDKVEDLDTEAEDHAADECLGAGTLITTEKGPRPIESIRVGDRVQTTGGMVPVSAVFSVGERAVNRVKFSDGRELVGTGDHPVWVHGEGFVPLLTLSYGDIMRTCPIQTNTAGSQGARGPLRTALFRPVMSFITETVTKPITTSPIFNLLPPKSIGAFIVRWHHRCREIAISVASHTKLMATAHGFARTPVNLHIGDRAVSMTSYEYAGAERASGLTSIPSSNFAPTLAEIRERTFAMLRNISARTAGKCSKRKTAEQSGAPCVVESVSPAGVQRVFNLTVEGPENYYANGVLTHNCRYACMSRPWIPRHSETITPQYHFESRDGVMVNTLTVTEMIKREEARRYGTDT